MFEKFKKLLGRCKKSNVEKRLEEYSAERRPASSAFSARARYKSPTKKGHGVGCLGKPRKDAHLVGLPGLSPEEHKAFAKRRYKERISTRRPAHA